MADTPFLGKSIKTLDWNGDEVTLKFGSKDVTLVKDGQNLSAYNYSYEDDSLTLTGISKFAGFKNAQVGAKAVVDAFLLGASAEYAFSNTDLLTGDAARDVLMDESSYKTNVAAFTNWLNYYLEKAYTDAATAAEDTTGGQFTNASTQIEVLKAKYGSNIFSDSDSVTFTVDTTDDATVSAGGYSIEEGSSFKLNTIGKFEVAENTNWATALGKGIAPTGSSLPTTTVDPDTTLTIVKTYTKGKTYAIPFAPEDYDGGAEGDSATKPATPSTVTTCYIWGKTSSTALTDYTGLNGVWKFSLNSTNKINTIPKYSLVSEEQAFDTTGTVPVLESHAVISAQDLADVGSGKTGLDANFVYIGKDKNGRIVKLYDTGSSLVEIFTGNAS